jgi:CheY-like chemotaxis protein
MLNPELYLTKTLLVVEDEDINFQLISMMLSKLGLNILRAVNGAVAVSICHTAQPLDLVLMDVRMPVMDGYEATEKIKKLRPDLPVIIQTAHSTIDDIAKAYASGCSDFIAKPFKRDQIIDKITEQLVKNRFSGNQPD